MRILRKVDGSVLWLFESNGRAKDNLCREAKRLGVNAERLVFAESLPVEEHLNRIRHADLFLDTLPYNAHTTASDALRMGVPLLTRAGNSFAGRVAASLLTSLDLGELITDAAESYERIAVELATDRERLRTIREKLIRKVQTSPLYDSELFTRSLEKAYDSMYERYQNDLAPGHIVVKP